MRSTVIPSSVFHSVTAGGRLSHVDHMTFTRGMESKGPPFLGLLGAWTAPKGLMWPAVVVGALDLGLVMTSLPSEPLIESKGRGRRSRKGWGTDSLRGSASMGEENNFSWLQLHLTRHPPGLSCC